MTDIVVVQDLQCAPIPRRTRIPWLKRRANKWRLTRDFVLRINGQEWRVPCEYVTDLASIPRVVWLIWPPSYGPARRGSVLHDRCYSHWFRSVPKHEADSLLREMMIHDGAPVWVANTFHWAVSTFGKGGYDE